MIITNNIEIITSSFSVLLGRIRRGFQEDFFFLGYILQDWWLPIVLLCYSVILNNLITL